MNSKAPGVGIRMKEPHPQSSESERSKVTHPVDDPRRVDILKREESLNSVRQIFHTMKSAY